MFRNTLAKDFDEILQLWRDYSPNNSLLSRRILYGCEVHCHKLGKQFPFLSTLLLNISNCEPKLNNRVITTTSVVQWADHHKCGCPDWCWPLRTWSIHYTEPLVLKVIGIKEKSGLMSEKLAATWIEPYTVVKRGATLWKFKEWTQDWLLFKFLCIKNWIYITFTQIRGWGSNGCYLNIPKEFNSAKWV